MALANAGTTGSSAASTAVPVAPYTGWSTLPTIDGSMELAAADDGNLYLSHNSASGSPPSPGTQFFSQGSIAYQDEQQRLFHYYPQAMDLYGVSRIRMASVMDTPLTSQLITLVPVSTPSGIAYVAADTEKGKFFLAYCTARGWSGSKVFIIKDPTAGIAALESGQVQWLVTGANVTNCNPLVLSSRVAGPLTPVS